MKITEKEVKRIASLSRLNFDDTALTEMGLHMDNILEFFKVIEGYDTSSVPATAHILSTVNVLRDDVASTPMPREELLSNAPESDDGAYIVPQVLD